MIDIVTDKDRNLKNLKQIGTPREEDKIYIENFAYAKIKENSYKEKRVFVFMGHTERMQGKYATFVEAVIAVRDIEFVGNTPRWSNAIWNEIFREIKRLYEDMIIVGWALDIKGMSLKMTPELERLHREYFGGAHQLLFLMDTLEQEETFYMYKENKLVPKEGFYIYHRARKKEMPQTGEQSIKTDRVPIRVREEDEVQNSNEFIRRLRTKGENVSASEVNVELDIPEVVGAKGRYRQMLQDNGAKKAAGSGNFGLGIAVAMLLFVVGVGVYENSSDLFSNTKSIETNLLQNNKKAESESDTVNTQQKDTSDTEYEVKDASGQKVEKIPIEIIPGVEN